MMLSILMPVFDHEKYLLTALQSIEKQNIRYSYEVLIAEDCSKDHSRKILEEYQKHAPSNFQFIYRDKNQGMLGNVSDLFCRAQGKYLITLEGDDFWLYGNKINEQIRFLENHLEYSGCAHSVVVVGADGKELGVDYGAEKRNGTYTLNDYLKGKLPGQTASFLYRNYFKEKNLFDYLHHNDKHPLDRFIAFVVASNGAVFCKDCKWSAYRYITDGGSSFSANYDGRSRAAADSVLKYHMSLYEYAVLEKKGRLCIQTSEKLFYKSYLRDWFQNDRRHVGKMMRKAMQARYPITTFFWILLQMVSMVKKHEGYIYGK